MTGFCCLQELLWITPLKKVSLYLEYYFNSNAAADSIDIWKLYTKKLQPRLLPSLNHWALTNVVTSEYTTLLWMGRQLAHLDCSPEGRGVHSARSSHSTTPHVHSEGYFSHLVCFLTGLCSKEETPCCLSSTNSGLIQAYKYIIITFNAVCRASIYASIGLYRPT